MEGFQSSASEPNVYEKTLVFRHLVSYSWKASSHQLQSLASIPQVAARDNNLGHLFFSFKEPFVFEEHILRGVIRKFAEKCY